MLERPFRANCLNLFCRHGVNILLIGFIQVAASILYWALCVCIFMLSLAKWVRDYLTGTEKQRTLRESIMSHENNQLNLLQCTPIKLLKMLRTTIFFFPAENILPSLQNLRCDADQVRNKTNLPSNLRTVAAKEGFLVSDNQASGNCLFYALSEQLKSVKGIQISQKELRNTLVQFLRENANQVRWLNFIMLGKKWQRPLVSPKKSKTIKPIW